MTTNRRNLNILKNIQGGENITTEIKDGKVIINGTGEGAITPEQIIANLEAGENVEIAINEETGKVKVSATGGGNESTYSLDERAVGKWINGETIYQKTFIFENVQFSQPGSIDLQTNLNIDSTKIIYIDGVAITTSNACENIGGFFNPEQFGVAVRYNDNGTIRFYASVSGGFNKIIITLQYYK